MTTTKSGYILIVLGFIGATLVAVQHHLEVNWTWFVPVFAIAVVGVVMVRRANKAAVEHADTIKSNIEDIDRSIKAIVENVSILNRDKETIHTYDMRHKIDELLLDDLNTFADARETIGTKYGLHNYADIMGHFAAGERYLNRVWSCSADGYIDEVKEYIDRAEEQFRDVLAKFQALRSGAA